MQARKAMDVISMQSLRPAPECGVPRHAGVRSTTTGLVGNTLNVDSLTWERFDASIGAGADSFYEYMLKVGAICFLHPFTCGTLLCGAFSLKPITQ